MIGLLADVLATAYTSPSAADIVSDKQRELIEDAKRYSGVYVFDERRADLCRLRVGYLRVSSVPAVSASNGAPRYISIEASFGFGARSDS